MTVQLSQRKAHVYGHNRAWWVIGVRDSGTEEWGKLLLCTVRLGTWGQNWNRTGQLLPFSEVAAVSIGILLHWQQLPQRPDWLWCLAVVSGALLLQVNDPAISYGWAQEIFTQKNKNQRANLLLPNRKPTKRFVQTMPQWAHFQRTSKPKCNVTSCLM